MRLPPAYQTLFSTLFLLPSVSNAVSIDCSHVLVDGVSFNLETLGGPKHVYDVRRLEDPPKTINTTYTIDVCRPLTRSKGVPKEEECMSGTQVCGIKRVFDPGESTTSITVIPIAGSYPHDSGRTLDPKWTRLKTSSSHADSEKEGIRLEMHGGMFPLHDGRKQKAVIEFLCDTSREDEDEKNGHGKGKGGLSFLSYGAPDGEETE
ncbi:hypothetical protein MMC08_006281, partial [Hypocenomyce scalaris]|nr:hypothetical protein [Hypocenomyce scalaris]